MSFVLALLCSPETSDGRFKQRADPLTDGWGYEIGVVGIVRVAAKDSKDVKALSEEGKLKFEEEKLKIEEAKLKFDNVKGEEGEIKEEN